MRAGARAALIALVLAVGLVDGLPIPAPERAERIAPGLGRLALGASEVRELALTPFRPLFGALHVTERWVLFAGASRERFRLEMAARRAPDSGWKLLYRADDERHRFLGELIEYRRVRGVYNPRTQEAPEGYPAFASFIARRVFVARPEFREVRVRMERIRIADEGGYRGTKEYAHELVRRRDEVLP
jgi:hypothetical protein